MTAVGRRSRKAYTLIEALIASTLLAVLVLLVSNAWRGLGRPLVDGYRRSRVSQEANLAAAALARDVGGSLPGSTGPPADGRLVGRLAVDGSQLWLCFDGGPAPNGTPDWALPDQVIVYRAEEERLVRFNQTLGTTHTVAGDLVSLTVGDQPDGMHVGLEFKHRDVERTFTLVVKDP